MLLDTVTLDLAPAGAFALEAAGGGPTFCRELPAAQLEIISSPAATVGEAILEVAWARQRIASATEGDLRLASAGTHPFAARHGVMSEHLRYQRLVAEYGAAATQALTCGLHVHVAVPGADRALAVHDALREYLPAISVLAGNSPFLEGLETGYASVRPKLSEALPRQGVPPALESWEGYHALLEWGAASHAFTPRELWWEARLHPTWGTIEVRAADAQLRSSHAAAIAAVIQCLVAALAEAYDADALAPSVPTERIAENRWRALRFGLVGTLLDPMTGRARGTRELVQELIEGLAPQALALGCEDELAAAVRLAERNGAEMQRAAAQDHGIRGLVGWMADEYVA